LTSLGCSIFGGSEVGLTSLDTVCSGIAFRPSRILTLPKWKVSGR
jgi:hypothetical protein